jgi:molecular chaperone DnaK
MSERSLYLGIDLGTTNSAAAVFDGTQVHLIRNPQGGSLTPSVVRLDARGQVTVGAKARRLLEADPANTRGEFKRLMGTGQQLEFPASGQKRTPESLSAEVLRSLRADVREQLGFEPAHAVISVPALFELPQASATSEAARLAGFERVELIQEPIASALAAGWTAKDASGAWMVYDLGGGTFDASLLETRDGLLRVVGHDGDNFLGGRDFDWALVDHVLDQLSKESGLSLKRADPALATGMAKLKLAVEDAKIELTRSRQTSLVLPGLALGPHVLDVDVTLTREDLERRCLALADRSVAVCLRLLAAHGLEPSQLQRMVLVGGPTVMPFLRARLKGLLGSPLEEGLDPMTLVAQGAALYAANVGLRARAASPAPEGGLRVWLQYPAMTSDLTPYVVGRFTGETGNLPVRVQLERQDGWKSAEAAVSAEHAFLVSVDLVPRQQSEFKLIARAADGAVLPVSPDHLTLVQGVTLGDPPLSRTLGVATADDRVQVYFERGAPLPAKRTFRHETVEALLPGNAGAVRIPVVQGEYEMAHLCRLVGALEIRGNQLQAPLPLGSEVELTLELDRGGRLAARALIVDTGQVFEQVAHLLVPSAEPAVLEKGLGATRERIAALRTAAFRNGLTRQIETLGGLDVRLQEVERDLEAARGGDADAGQKARRALLETDATLEDLEAESRLPELEEEALDTAAWASRWVSELGSPQEQRLLDDAVGGLERARKSRQQSELQRRLRQVRQLGIAAYYRHPEAWAWQFESAASEVHAMRDLPKAEKLVSEGRAALKRGDKSVLRRVTEQLWRLMPADAQARQMGHDSGLR